MLAGGAASIAAYSLWQFQSRWWGPAVLTAIALFPLALVLRAAGAENRPGRVTALQGAAIGAALLCLALVPAFPRAQPLLNALALLFGFAGAAPSLWGFGQWAVRRHSNDQRGPGE